MCPQCLLPEVENGSDGDPISAFFSPLCEDDHLLRFGWNPLADFKKKMLEGQMEPFKVKKNIGTLITLVC